MKSIISIFSIFLFIGNLAAGTIDPGTSDKKYVDYAKDFHYIGKLCGSYEDQTLFCASAVVIDNHNLLTAAHVVKGYKDCKVTIKDKEYIVRSFRWPEDFNENVFGMNDIAIGFIEESIDLDFYPDLYDSDDEMGKVCSISGYGLTGNFLTGAKVSDSKKRAGSNIVDDIQEQLLICRPSKAQDPTFTSLEFLIASGDSGGGLFIDSKLAGINSCVMGSNKKVNSTYETESGHTRISVHKEWILKNIKSKR